MMAMTTTTMMARTIQIIGAPRDLFPADAGQSRSRASLASVVNGQGLAVRVLRELLVPRSRRGGEGRGDVAARPRRDRERVVALRGRRLDAEGRDVVRVDVVLEE